MKLPPPSAGGGDFTPPPAGAHRAVCYRVIDLGTQETEFQGQKKRQRKILITWELPDERMEIDGSPPFSVNQRYTFSGHEKATLRQHLEAWRGREFSEQELNEGMVDLRNLLGKSCLLSLIHQERAGKTYANITGVSKLPKGMASATPENPIHYLSLEPDEFVLADYNTLTDGLRAVIAKSPEFAEAMKDRTKPADAPFRGDAGYDDHHDGRGPPDFDNSIGDDIPF